MNSGGAAARNVTLTSVTLGPDSGTPVPGIEGLSVRGIDHFHGNSAGKSRRFSNVADPGLRWQVRRRDVQRERESGAHITTAAEGAEKVKKLSGLALAVVVI